MTTQNIPLNEDQQAVAARLASDIQHAVGTVASTSKEGCLDGQLAESCLKVAEFKLAEMCQLLGVETDSRAEREERYAKLRAANCRIRDLEAQLGASQGPDVTQASLKAMDKRLNSWWDLEGFGHVSDLAFGAYGCKVTLSCSLFGNFRLTESPTPVSDKERRKQWHEALRERGFVLVQEDRDWELLDCESSRSTLCDLLMSRLPSARIVKLENHNRGRSARPEFILRSVEVFIRDIEDILQLPQLPAE